MRSNFNVVHRLNPECGAKALVPLPEQPELDVSFEHLRDLNSNPEFGPDYRFPIKEARRSYVISELLGSVSPDELCRSVAPKPENQPAPTKSAAEAAGGTAIRDLVILIAVTAPALSPSWLPEAGSNSQTG